MIMKPWSWKRGRVIINDYEALELEKGRVIINDYEALELEKGESDYK